LGKIEAVPEIPSLALHATGKRVDITTLVKAMMHKDNPMQKTPLCHKGPELTA
jgi:hypothetical protein